VSRYTVVSFDNAHPDRVGASLRRDELDNDQEALAHAKQLVDRALERLCPASSAHELMILYARRGSDVPVIYGEPRVDFRAYQYAREKATAMFASPALT